jgi:hypothetical protein
MPSPRSLLAIGLAALVLILARYLHYAYRDISISNAELYALAAVPSVLTVGAFVWSAVLGKGTKVLAAVNLVTATFFLLFLIAPFDPSVDETFMIVCTLLYGAQAVTLAVSMLALSGAWTSRLLIWAGFAMNVLALAATAAIIWILAHAKFCC